MFRGDLIIDGYNLLHAGTFDIPGRQGGLEQERRFLLELIADKLTSRERQRTTIVFDAPARVMESSSVHRFHGLSILFAGGDGDADVVIERLIRQNSAPRRLCVVSSDHRLQRAARRRRARFLDSDVFLTRLVRRPSREARSQFDRESAAKREGGLPPAEVEAWLRVFHDVEDVPARTGPRQRQTESSEPSGSAATKRSGPGMQSDHPSAPAQSMDHDAVPGEMDEVSFWEARLADLERELRSNKDGRH